MVKMNLKEMSEEDRIFLEEFEAKQIQEQKDEAELEELLKSDDNKKESFKDKVWNYFTKPLKGRPKNLTKFLKKNPNIKIVELRICRQPVEKYISYFMNLLTKGKYERVKEEYNYDNIYHLFIILIFDNGQAYHFEKNEIVVINQITPQQNMKHTDCHNRFTNKKFIDLIEEAESDYKNLYFYSAHRDNCQTFIRQLVRKLGIKDLNGFIMQYGSQEILANKSVQGLTVGITTMANAGRKVLGLD